MAQIDNTSNCLIRPVRSAYGSPAIRHFQESTCAATAVIRRGDIVSFDTVVTTGYMRIVRCPSSGGTGTNLMELVTQSLVGVALADSTSDGSITGLSSNGSKTNSGVRQIPVALADGFTEFAINISTAGANPLPVDSTLIGRNFAVIHDRTRGRWFLDSTNSTAALVTVTVTDVPVDSIGDTGGVVYFKFLSSNVSRSVRVGGPSV